MLQSNKDLYQSINELINILQENKNNEYAMQLKEALSVSTVPGEVLGELRLVLIKLSNASFIKQLNIGNKISESLSDLEKIL